MRMLITGATGFVGRALVAQAAGTGSIAVRAAVRGTRRDLPVGIEAMLVGDMSTDTNWRRALTGMDVVVHLAARVHVMSETAADPLEEFRRVNVAGTLHLARQAAELGVKRFVFLSSAKVNGEGSAVEGVRPGTGAGPYRESDLPAPEDAYGISKHEAELGLRELGAETGMSVTIIRPPLVYGPGVQANFLALMRAVARGTILPFGSVHNRRSLVALDNLVDFILTCVKHPAAANETFLVSDGEDLSTTELIRGLAVAVGRPTRLVSVPASVLRIVATLLGKREVARRLLGSLQVDISKARRVLNWMPPIRVNEGLTRATRPLRDGR